MLNLATLVFVVALFCTGVLFLAYKWKVIAKLEGYLKKPACYFCLSFWLSLICLWYETKPSLSFSYAFSLAAAGLICAVIVSYILPRIILTNEKN
ncbi:hypothetical protein DR864_00330 [Runella rosea]|uniref:Uncharacterized protein n=1 Tax=Runella rosea TaxID=2259595 RepID=A0A344TCA8_9BACT|nr:hypothetical protein [Runella rosea]AXE16223.1 hypothetical protein DR864_00050 [Runella rosea]AXE16279.1 hypothetical protein DR864_00330 [Runella rosea]